MEAVVRRCHFCGHELAAEPEEPGAVATFLADRFREKRRWKFVDLLKAAETAGLGFLDLHSTEAMRLPINKRQEEHASGERYWVWRAVEGWPSEQERTDDHATSQKGPRVRH